MDAAMLMMEPGPTLVDDRVIQALCVPVVHHQSPEFAVTMDTTCHLLRGIFGSDGEVVVLPASGRGAVEAALASVREEGRAFVVANNGTFGRMMATIGRSVGLEVVELRHGSGEPLSRDAIASALAGLDRPILGLVHNETATGMVNDIGGYADLVHERGGLLLVDAVSSLGGAELASDRNGVDFCVSASQKSMGALAGLSFVAVSDRALREIDARTDLARGNYLDLRRWWDLWVAAEHGGRLASGFRRLPWTMPTHLVGALHRACELAYDEGLKERWDRHRRCGAALRAALDALGMPTLAPDGAASDTVTAFGRPDLDAKALKRRMADRHGIRLATGMDADAPTVMRVAHMAETAHPGPQVRTLAALAIELTAMGLAAPTDAARVFLDAWNAPRA